MANDAGVGSERVLPNERWTARSRPTRPLEPVEPVEPEPEPDSPEHADVLAAGTCIGRYSVLSLLGEGGMGMVYEAWDPQLARRVALKLLHPKRALDEGPPPNERLLTEAQALAKIEHPNIVSVYDAGTTAHGVFIAMELCRGQSLRSWMELRERSVRELLDAYIAAGRGLAAAHRAGIVHRDFKPTNVLIGDDGWVKVADFGLARSIDVGVGPVDSTSASITDCERSASTIVGTPAYMSPEQLVGREGDHRMDQFSFCVCLYQALVGQPPFPDGTLHARRRQVLSGLGSLGRHRLALARHVPARVRRAVRRGLSVEPSERFESMETLLAELAERKHWPWTLSSVTLGLGLGLGVLAMTEVRPEPCARADEALGDAWGPERRSALTQAIERTGHPDAADRIERATQAFDRRAREWQAAHAAACRATYEGHTQSETAFELRMRCLERQRARLDIAVDVMMQAADPAQLDARMPVPFRLPAVDECRDVEALASAAPLPAGPLHAHVQQLERRLDRADALREGGALREGLEVAAAAVVEARTLDHPPILAQALECLGRLQADGDSPQAAERTLREAIEVGARGHDDRVVARAWPSLLYALVLQDELAAGEALAFAAETAVARTGDELARAWLLNTLGILHGERGDHDGARTHLQHALEVKRQLHGPHHLDVGITWINLGFALADGERWDEAADAFGHAQVILAATVGDTHPMADFARAGLCHVAVAREQHEVALELCTRALHGLEVSATSPALESRVRVITAQALRGLGRPQEALHMAEHARAQVVGVDPRKTTEIDAWMEEVRRELRASRSDQPGISR